MRPGHAFVLLTLILMVLVVAAPTFAQGTPPLGFVNKLGQDLDVRSGSRILFDEIRSGVILPESGTPPVTGLPTVPQVQLRGDNQQVNDPAADGIIQILPGFGPFVRATQSETSAAAFGQNIVVTYTIRPASTSARTSAAPDSSSTKLSSLALRSNMTAARRGKRVYAARHGGFRK